MQVIKNTDIGLYDLKQNAKSGLFYNLGILSSIVIIISINLPTIKLINTKIGNISLASCFIILGLIFFIMTMLKNNIKVNITKTDVIFYLFSLLTLTITVELSRIAYVFIIIIFPYVIGKIFSNYNAQEKIKTILIIKQFSSITSCNLHYIFQTTVYKFNRL